MSLPDELPAAVSVSEGVDYYAIDGSTAEHLRMQLNELGPVNDEGERHDAYTSYFIVWRFSYERSNSMCTAVEPNVDVSVRIEMPQWKGAAGELGDRWNRYTVALRAHEEGHGDIAVRAGIDIFDTLSGLDAQPTCDAMGEVANQAGNDLLGRSRSDTEQYDRDTQHGTLTGAVFP